MAEFLLIVNVEISHYIARNNKILTSTRPSGLQLPQPEKRTASSLYFRSFKIMLSKVLFYNKLCKND